MIRVLTSVQIDAERVQREGERYTRGFLFRVGAFMRTVVRRGIRRRPKPAAAGRPIHSRTGRVRDSIVYRVDAPRRTVSVGVLRQSLQGLAGTHETGGSFAGSRYPARPFIRPGFEKTVMRGSELARPRSRGR